MSEGAGAVTVSNGIEPQRASPSLTLRAGVNREGDDMQCPPEIAGVVGEILSWGLLHIRVEDDGKL